MNKKFLLVESYLFESNHDEYKRYLQECTDFLGENETCSFSEWQLIEESLDEMNTTYVNEAKKKNSKFNTDLTRSFEDRSKKNYIKAFLVGGLAGIIGGLGSVAVGALAATSGPGFLLLSIPLSMLLTKILNSAMDKCSSICKVGTIVGAISAKKRLCHKECSIKAIDQLIARNNKDINAAKKIKNQKVRDKLIAKLKKANEKYKKRKEQLKSEAAKLRAKINKKSKK